MSMEAREITSEETNVLQYTISELSAEFIEEKFGPEGLREEAQPYRPDEITEMITKAAQRFAEYDLINAEVARKVIEYGEDI